MTKKILIDAKYPNEIRAVLVNNQNIIEEIECQSADKQQIKGNIYLAKVARVEPALQAAFITYENGKTGFLSFFEIHPSFFNVDDVKTNNSINKIKLPEEINKDTPKPDVDQAEAEDIATLNPPSLEDKIDLESVYDEIEEVKTQYENIYRKYNIQDVIKKGQMLLVQAQKDERGNKAASFTTFLSIAGKFCILMPNTDKQNGISRRIVSTEERKRLKAIMSNMIPEENSQTSSLILRTAAIDRTLYEIQRDYQYLVRIWNKIGQAAINTTAPNAIHIEEEIIAKIIRDMLDCSVSQIMIQGKDQYAKAIEFATQIVPSEIDKIAQYHDSRPIFTVFNVEEQILNLYHPVVPLPSGGYIVINPTEALTSIDVNSGKSINEKNIQETAFKTNLEAAAAIAKQIKLRDISGIIVVDFIDLLEAKNRKLLEQAFKEHLAKDKSKIHASHISQLGLMEISRQRLKATFLESNSAACSYCSGKGVVRSCQANAMLILRTIEKELCDSKVNLINVFAHLDSILYILNKKRADIERIETEFNIDLHFQHDPLATAESFYIEKIQLQKAPKRDRAKAISLNENKESAVSAIKSTPEMKMRPKEEKPLPRKKPAPKSSTNPKVTESKVVKIAEVQETAELVEQRIEQKADQQLELEGQDMAPAEKSDKKPIYKRKRSFIRKKKPSSSSEENNPPANN